MWKILPHTYIGKETGFEGDGILRAFMAVVSLGASELPQHTFGNALNAAM